MSLNRMKAGVKTPKNWHTYSPEKKLKVLDQLIAKQKEGKLTTA